LLIYLSTILLMMHHLPVILKGKFLSRRGD
jgi:hypothetical protein